MLNGRPCTSALLRLPKAVACFAVTSRAAYESAFAAAATHLALRLAEDALCETAYLADVAGLSYDVRGWFLTVLLPDSQPSLAAPFNLCAWQLLLLDFVITLVTPAGRCTG